MASPFSEPGLADKNYVDPTPMPENIPRVAELGTTSAPLKSAAFFIGAYCKEYNGRKLLCDHSCSRLTRLYIFLESRGLYVVQSGGQKPGSLLEGRPESHPVCYRPVRSTVPPLQFNDANRTYPLKHHEDERELLEGVRRALELLGEE